MIPPPGQAQHVAQSSQAPREIDALGPVRMIDQGVAIALFPLNQPVSVSLVHRDGVVTRPPQQHVEPLARVLALIVVNLSRVAEQKVQRGSRDRAFPAERLELARVRLTAVGLFNVIAFKIEVGDVRAKRVALDLAREQVVPTEYSVPVEVVAVAGRD